MNKEDIINYVAQTPYNSNKKVLGDMLDTLMEENKGNDNIMFCNFIYHSLEDGEWYALDTKEEDVWSAVRGGKLVYARILYDGVPGGYVYKAEDIGDEVVHFTRYFIDSIDNKLYMQYILSSRSHAFPDDANGKSWLRGRDRKFNLTPTT